MFEIIASVIAIIVGIFTFLYTSSSGWSGGNNSASGMTQKQEDE